MKRLGIFLVPPGGDASPWYPFIHLGGERHFESRVSATRVRTRTSRSRGELSNNEATAPPSPGAYSWPSLSSSVEIKIGSLYSFLAVGYLAVSHGILFGPQFRLVARIKFNIQNCKFLFFWEGLKELHVLKFGAGLTRTVT